MLLVIAVSPDVALLALSAERKFVIRWFRESSLIIHYETGLESPTKEASEGIERLVTKYFRNF